jgi:glycosyltransferase involved in cell wall biosynthesis
MNIYYISPSIIPSRTANSVHVVHMCDGLRKAGARLDLFFATESSEPADLQEKITSQYGVSLDGMRLRPVSIKTQRGMALRIAARSVLVWLKAVGLKSGPQLIFSRNLYAAGAFKLFKRRGLIYETHQVEAGFRGWIQRWLASDPDVLTVVISDALKGLLASSHSIDVNNLLVAHDGVNEELIAQESAVSGDSKGHVESLQTRFSVGYFGHLYKGRGIEIIIGLAQRHPEIDFKIFGGTDELVSLHRSNCMVPNCHFFGFVNHTRAMAEMRRVDALVMPYQQAVAIDSSGKSDTAKYMSPMKMFEYMASGVPLISSRLAVLQEVLEEGANCLMANPDDIDEWSIRLTQLRDSKDLRAALAKKALIDVTERYTWVARARHLLNEYKRRNSP